MKKLSKKYCDDDIIENEGCINLDCTDCYYTDKIHICPEGDIEKNADYFASNIYNHVLNIKKIKKIKKILNG